MPAYGLKIFQVPETSLKNVIMSTFCCITFLFAPLPHKSINVSFKDQYSIYGSHYFLFNCYTYSDMFVIFANLYTLAISPMEK